MEEILRRYDAVDINVYAASLFHTRMMIKAVFRTIFSRRIFMSSAADPAGDHEQPAGGNDRDFNGRNIY